MNENEANRSSILGQKYAFATVSLILGILSFVNLFGLEKPILAIIFGWLALRLHPEPKLNVRRVWAQVGIALGAITLITVPILIIMNYDRLLEILDALSKITGGR